MFFVVLILSLTAAKVTELEQKLSNLQSGTMHAGVEIEVFRSRIETLEAEKREAMAAFDRKASEVDQVNADYQTMTGRYQEVKKENAKLESQVRDAKASEMSQKVGTTRMHRVADCVNWMKRQD